MNLTKVAGSHNLKAGLFFEYTTRPAARSSQFNGTFNFNRDTNNPLDTNHPFANALIGSVQSYSEATGHPIANAQFANVEWFVQDNWRVAKNLTIDAGVRFYKIGPTKSQGDQLAVFLPDQYNPAAAPALIQPVSTPQGRRGRNPITGEIVPAVKIGTFAPGLGRPDQRHRGVPRERDGHAADPGRAARGLLVGRQAATARRRCAAASACSPTASTTTSSCSTSSCRRWSTRRPPTTPPSASCSRRR